MAKYKAYPEYKDSGVDWIGEIPTSWRATQVKYGYEVVLGKMLQKEKRNGSEKRRSYLKAQNIQPTGLSLKTVDKMWFSLDERKRLLLKHGDVLVSEGGDVGRAAIWREELGECYIQNALNRVRSKSNSSTFFYYWISFLKNTDFINILCNKATIAHYTAEKLKESPLFLPNISEQEKIAKFLDHETAKIDKLIEKQKQLIELLNEKRQAVISQAVTKGLDSSVPMKDSGVEWLGDVPENWRVVKLSYFLRLQSGDGITSEKIEPEGAYPVYGGNGIRGYTDSFNCDGGYVLIGRQGALCGNVHLASGQFYASEHAVVVYPRVRFSSIYLLEFLRFMNLGQYSVSAAQPGVSVERINMLSIVLPPFEEQEKIAFHIREFLLKNEKTILKSQKQICLLEERRTSLISAAVTGKIDVRDIELI